jgi:FkbM family methyltransferase
MDIQTATATATASASAPAPAPAPAPAESGHPRALLCLHGHSFMTAQLPVVARAVGEFCNGAEEGTLRFFDAVLPHCRRFIDVGAYIGLLSLYASDRVEDIFAFEPSPTHQRLFAANIGANQDFRPDLAERITLVPAALGVAERTAALFRKAFADSGSSLFQSVERHQVLHGQAEAQVPVLAGAKILDEIGLDSTTLIKIDIEGSEYDLIPALAPLLARCRPFLHLSFHPFNLLGETPVETAFLRLRRGLELAEALQCYNFIYLFQNGAWREVTRETYPDFIGDYLLNPKPVPRIASPQYGFVDAAGFSAIRLDLAAMPFAQN